VASVSAPVTNTRARVRCAIVESTPSFPASRAWLLATLPITAAFESPMDRIAGPALGSLRKEKQFF